MRPYLLPEDVAYIQPMVIFHNYLSSTPTSDIYAVRLHDEDSVGVSLQKCYSRGVHGIPPVTSAFPPGAPVSSPGSARLFRRQGKAMKITSIERDELRVPLNKPFTRSQKIRALVDCTQSFAKSASMRGWSASEKPIRSCS